MAFDKVIDSVKLEADLTTVADAIREKTGEMEKLSFPGGVAKGVDAVFEAGKKAEYDAFWDVYQENGNRTHYNTAFAGFGWNDIIFNPKYPLNNIYYAANMFLQSGIKEKEVILDLTEMQSQLTNTFNSSTIKNITITVPENLIYYDVFLYCKNLINLKVNGLIGGSGFNLKDSYLLSKDSIISVINALSLNKTSLTVTFSQTAVNNAFETSEGAADGSTSEEWTTLIATKPNWTISLV